MTGRRLVIVAAGATGLAQTGKVKVLVDHFALDEAEHAYHLLHDGKIQGRAVITPHG